MERDLGGFGHRSSKTGAIGSAWSKVPPQRRLAMARPVTAEGTISKIEVGLRLQEPLDLEDCASVLVSSGLSGRRKLIDGTAGSETIG